MPQFVLGVIVGAALTLVLVVWLVLNRSWRYAAFAGASIPWPGILGMRLRGTPTPLIVDAYVALRKRGHALDWSLVEATYLASRARGRLDAAALIESVEQQLARNQSESHLHQPRAV